MSQVCTASTKPGHAGWAGSAARCGTKGCLLKQSLGTQDEPAALHATWCGTKGCLLKDQETQLQGKGPAHP